MLETKKYSPSDYALGCYKGMQTTTESVADYLVRLTKVFTDNSDMQKPDNPQKDTPWEQLKTCFLDGMNEDISHQVKKHCIVWERGCLNTIQDHAIHAEKNPDISNSKSLLEQRKIN